MVALVAERRSGPENSTSTGTDILNPSGTSLCFTFRVTTHSLLWQRRADLGELAEKRIRN